ncbi:MAG: MoaD/ThiS family protein [Hyphomicrobium sp.]
MPRVVFASALQRHVQSPPLDVDGATVRAALDAAFVINPRVRGYILDDQSHLRKHMNIFVDGVAVRDRTALAQPVASSATIYVVQALSGG